jgi:hypothetical protein
MSQPAPDADSLVRSRDSAGVSVSYGPGLAFGIVFVEQDREDG